MSRTARCLFGSQRSIRTLTSVARSAEHRLCSGCLPVSSTPATHSRKRGGPSRHGFDQWSLRGFASAGDSGSGAGRDGVGGAAESSTDPAAHDSSSDRQVPGTGAESSSGDAAALGAPVSTAVDPFTGAHYCGVLYSVPPLAPPFI